MRHAIDPKIDCVFKALLGAEENRNLLIHFLNAFLAQELGAPIVSVDILNPYNAKEFISDKLSIVDVKAQDQLGRLYQVEIQLSNHANLPARIVYNWADIYSQQLKSGQDYGELKPTYSIWLLAENLLTHDKDYVHHYKIRDEQGKAFALHGGIWLLELAKFTAGRVESEDQRWLQFFKVGEQLNDAALPEWMMSEEMKQAMNTLTAFSEKDREYFQYQARQEYLRVQRTIERDREERRLEMEQTHLALEQSNLKLEHTEQALLKAKLAEEQAKLAEEQAKFAEQQAKLAEEQAKLAEEQAKRREQAALAEIEQLKALLANKAP